MFKIAEKNLRQTSSFVWLSIVFLIIGSNAFGQSTTLPKTEKEVKNLLCHKWQLVSIKIGGEIVPIEGETKAFYIIFLENGRFIDYFEGNSPSNKWVYNHKDKTITTSRNMSKKILRIDEKELMLMNVSDGVSSILSLRRVD